MPKFTLYDAENYYGGCLRMPAPSGFDKSNPTHRDMLAEALSDRQLALVAYNKDELIVRKVK